MASGSALAWFSIVSFFWSELGLTPNKINLLSIEHLSLQDRVYSYFIPSGMQSTVESHSLLSFKAATLKSSGAPDTAPEGMGDYHEPA